MTYNKIKVVNVLIFKYSL